MKDLNAQFRNRIKNPRGIPQKIHAELGSSEQNVRDILNGKIKNITIEFVHIIAKHLEVRAGWLAFGEEPQRPLTLEEIAFVWIEQRISKVKKLISLRMIFYLS